MRFRQGSGRLCLDYLRTLRHGTVDELSDDAAVRAWTVQFGPFGRVDTPDSAELADQAQRLRESIRVLVDTARQGLPCPPSERKRINASATTPPSVPSLGADGQLRWQAEDPVAAMLSSVARDALDLVTSPLLARVRECAGAGCGALFVDTSRPGSRRWCSMNTCGNRAKKSAMNNHP